MTYSRLRGGRNSCQHGTAAQLSTDVILVIHNHFRQHRVGYYKRGDRRCEPCRQTVDAHGNGQRNVCRAAWSQRRKRALQFPFG